MFIKKQIILTAVVFILFLPVLAFAGVIELPQTGQTKCYDSAGVEIACAGTGQDREIRAGVPWPNPRFTVSGDCVMDNLTGLMWPKNGNLAGGYMTWNSAIDYANNLTLCGYSDWRLPNVNELESLVNADVSNTATWLNTQGFYNVLSGSYWSSTTGADSTDDSWVVAIWSGYVEYYYKGGVFYVWPVRSGQTGTVQLPETGQTTSYDVGDDGDLERGVAWPSSRFAVSGNCVTDNLTGLMWARNANLAGYMNWNAALNYANNLTLCGYADWRLPNRKELRSLIDYSNYGPALPTGHPFTNVQSFYYWSSTTFAYNTYNAWIVYMWYGYVYSYSKDYYSSYVWPVRSGHVDLDNDGYASDVDCDDNDPLVNPGATEVCDGIDNDCDAQVDEGLLNTYYEDVDGDGYGYDGMSSIEACAQPSGYAADNTDCNDNDPAINPGATEILKNGIDDDCNSSTPDSADLYISSVSAPSSANSGQTISVSDTTNKSGVSLVGATTTKIYLSTDNKWWTNDTELGSRAVPAFGAGAQSSSGSTNVTIPANTCTRTYYLIARADADKVITEWNEGNNNNAKSIAITGGQADLYVSSVTAPVSANAGDTITVTDTTNKSGCSTGASTTRVYLSKYANGYGGIEIGSGRAVPAFGTGTGSSSGGTSGTIPYGGCTGSCYIVIKADADGTITEWNEGNNKRATAITIGP